MNNIILKEIDNYPIKSVRENLVKEMNNKGYSLIGFSKIMDESMWRFKDFIVKKIILKFKK